MQPRRGGEPSQGLRRHRPDMLMLLFIIILLLLGLVIIYAISPALAARMNAAGQDLGPNHFIYRQLLYISIGVVAFTTVALLPLKLWEKFQTKLLILGLAVGLSPFVLQATPLGMCANGACRWVDFGPVTFQPAEAMKFALVIFLAGFLAARIRQGKLNDVQATLVPIGLVMLAMAVIVIGLQKDLGTGITIVAIVMTMLFMAGIARRLMLMAVGASLAIGVIFTIIAPHRIERVMTFFNHSNSTTEGMGYHIHQALIAVGSGGITGRGLGQSIQAFGYLPEAANDSIFAIMAENFGFLGTIAVLAIFTALFLRLLRIMDHTAKIEYKLIVAGVFGWIFSHTAVNIGSMLGIFPLTGITLPFVSFGGTSLLFILCALGLVFHISRYTSHTLQLTTDDKGDTNDYSRRGRGLGGPRNPGARRTA